jgi:hypothetical protein
MDEKTKKVAVVNTSVALKWFTREEFSEIAVRPESPVDNTI